MPFIINDQEIIKLFDTFETYISKSHQQKYINLTNLIKIEKKIKF